MRTFLIILASFYCAESYTQDSTYPAHGNEEFKKFDIAIKSQCGIKKYYSKKLKKGIIKKELKLVKLVDDVVQKKETIDSLLSTLKAKSIKFQYETYEKNNHSIQKIYFQGEYLKFSIVKANNTKGDESYLGAAFKSTYRLYCKKNAPESEIYAIDMDIDFFREKVIKSITSKYQVYNVLNIGDASYISDNIRIIFW
jgi:hypothetical protein